MDSDGYAFLVDLVGARLLGGTSRPSFEMVEHYWSGDVQVPAAIDSDVAAYLSQSDLQALTRVAIWIANNFLISDYSAKHHMSLVRWLFEHDLVKRPDLPRLLALVSWGGQLDEAGKEIVLLSSEMFAEGRMAEAGDLLEPLILVYRPDLR